VHTGQVIGTVVSTVKYKSLEGKKLLVVQPLDTRREPLGDPVIAVDAQGNSGEGEFVYVVTKKEAGFEFPEWDMPVDHAIVGYIDEYKVVK